MTEDQRKKEQSKQLILAAVKKEKLENAKQLIDILQKNHAMLPTQSIKLIIELENENRLDFTHLKMATAASLKTYLISMKALWYWVTIAFISATALAVFVISNSDYPIVYLRSALGLVFMLLLPGYVLMKLLFPTNLPKRVASLTQSQKGVINRNIDSMERIALSIGISLALTPMVGLILNYTPWGIRMIPITLSLVTLTFVFATAAFVRDFQESVSTIENNS